MKQFWFTFFLFSVFNPTSFSLAEANFNNGDYQDKKLSRSRLTIGYARLLEEDDGFKFKHPFFNLSYRSSSFNRSSSDLKIKFAFETGVNGLLIVRNASPNKLDYSIYFLPYAKFGPEMRLNKNLFLSTSIGLALVSYETSFAPLPFIGINGFYLYEFNETILIELESGFHTSIRLPLFAYATIGISLL